MLGGLGLYTVWDCCSGRGPSHWRVASIKQTKGNGTLSSDTDTSQTEESTGGPAQGEVADAIGDAVKSLEAAATKAVQACADAGDPERAHRIAAAVTEALDRVVAEIDNAAETVEEAAEEVAESALPEEAAQAEQAVDEAQEAQEATEDAEEALRDQTRELGGGEATEAAAVDEEIHQSAEEVAETVPVENAPGIAAEESFEQEIADMEQAAPERPDLIEPVAEHPYYRKRAVRLFGRKINL